MVLGDPLQVDRLYALLLDDLEASSLREVLSPLPPPPP